MPLNFLWVGLSQQNLHHHQPHLSQAHQQRDRTRRGGRVRGHLWGRAVFRVRGYSLPSFTLYPPQARRRGFKRTSHQDHGACGVGGGGDRPSFPAGLSELQHRRAHLAHCRSGAQRGSLGVYSGSQEVFSLSREKQCLACGP